MVIKFTVPKETMKSKTNWGGIFKRLREGLKISKTEAARRAGVNHATICRLEDGTATNITIGTLERLFAVVGREIVYTE